jgi:hypothetical protein
MRSIFWEAWEQFAEVKIKKSEIANAIAQGYQSVLNIWNNI